MPNTSSVSPIALVDPNDPALTEPLHIDPNAVPLQHGLVYAPDGQVTVKPDIAAELEPSTLTRALRLIASGRLGEANSIVACRHIQNVISYCSNHEAEYAAVICNKPLLHASCATPKSRVAKFSHEHPQLYSHLLRSVFHRIEFTVPERLNPEQSRSLFARFRAALDLDDDSDGWQWLWAYSDDGTTFRAIHEGSRLPYWPELNALWRRIAGNSATLRIRTYDGRDGDSQREGLLNANSGFIAYWDAVDHGTVDPIEESLRMRGEDLTNLYGKFRGFSTAPISPDDDDPDTDPAPDPESQLPLCRKCGTQHVPARGIFLLTKRELAERFDHIQVVSYGQKRRLMCQHAHTGNPVAPSPPPW